MQLRDDIPTILYPGCWTLFGGHLEPGENPVEGIRREIWEEIAFHFEDATFFDCYTDELAIRHIFYGPLTVPLDSLTLQEGWDFALVSPEAILSGQIYSPKDQIFKPVGDKHQEILRGFFQAALQ